MEETLGLILEKYTYKIMQSLVILDIQSKECRDQSVIILSLTGLIRL